MFVSLSLLFKSYATVLRLHGDTFSLRSVKLLVAYSFVVSSDQKEVKCRLCNQATSVEVVGSMSSMGRP